MTQRTAADVINDVLSHGWAFIPLSGRSRRSVTEAFVLGRGSAAEREMPVLPELLKAEVKARWDEICDLLQTRREFTRITEPGGRPGWRVAAEPAPCVVCGISCWVMDPLGEHRHVVCGPRDVVA